MRYLSVLLTCLGGASLAGCYGTEVPPQTQEENPVGSMQATAKDPQATDAPGTVKRSAFNKDVAQPSINRASRQASQCPQLHPEGPFGDVTVTVTISSAGSVTGVQIPPPFGGTQMAKCIENSFAHEVFDPWSGPEAQVDAPLSLKKPDAAAAPPAKK